VTYLSTSLTGNDVASFPKQTELSTAHEESEINLISTKSKLNKDFLSLLIATDFMRPPLLIVEYAISEMYTQYRFCSIISKTVNTYGNKVCST
jgi:hypothetical protein